MENWQNEFKKWLGDERIRVFAMEGKQNIQDFLKSRIHDVLIIGYERLCSVMNVMVDFHFDLVVCDEGHRLKNSAIKSSSLLNSLPCNRRIILSGTPIQNHLSEFYSMVEFVNPGFFGTYSSFKKRYENYITAALNGGAEAGIDRLQEVKLGEYM